MTAAGDSSCRDSARAVVAPSNKIVRIASANRTTREYRPGVRLVRWAGNADQTDARRSARCRSHGARRWMLVQGGRREREEPGGEAARVWRQGGADRRESDGQPRGAKGRGARARLSDEGLEAVDPRARLLRV